MRAPAVRHEHSQGRQRVVNERTPYDRPPAAEPIACLANKHGTKQNPYETHA
jgi:hypothetical protein